MSVPHPSLDDNLARMHRDLVRTWADPPGIKGWLSAINHQTIGRRFIVTAFAFFILGGILAGLMRLQLSRPDNGFIGPDLYNQIFTMHGLTMMFLFAVPVMEAMGVYLLPLLVGARNIAFPRLGAFAYWMFLFGGVFLWVSFLLRIGPDVGWFAYVPLSGPEYTPGKRADVWAQMITFTELSALVVAIQLITTAFKMRAPGMSLNRVPVFVWALVVTSFMIMFAMPSVMVASTALILDRLVGTHFFNHAEGGDPILWQHLFWFFGHPEVYIIFLPANGMVSLMVQEFSRRPIFGYTAVVLSLVSTAFIAFGVWVHHMFATGIPQLGQSFFSAASMLIVVPTGVQVFCWIVTLWTGRPRLKTPLLFVCGFFVIFILGGMTGVMLASVPFDLQVHDTFFVVAHFHYVLIGGAVFPLFGALFYWFPKITGRMLSEALGHVTFWLFFIGFNLTFFPMHLLGLNGMPRRVYTYPSDVGWGTLNAVASAGAVLMVLGVLVLLVNVVRSLRHGVVAGDDPWESSTLEWATSSPPPAYNFLLIPTVSSATPLWDPRTTQPVVTGLSTTSREVLITHALDAEPDHRMEFPRPSIWPLLTALAVTVLFVGSIFTPWAIVYGSVPVFIALTAWFWPTVKDKERAREKAREAHEPRRLLEEKHA